MAPLLPGLLVLFAGAVVAVVAGARKSNRSSFGGADNGGLCPICGGATALSRTGAKATCRSCKATFRQG